MECCWQVQLVSAPMTLCGVICLHLGHTSPAAAYRLWLISCIGLCAFGLSDKLWLTALKYMKEKLFMLKLLCFVGGCLINSLECIELKLKCIVLLYQLQHKIVRSCKNLYWYHFVWYILQPNRKQKKRLPISREEVWNMLPRSSENCLNCTNSDLPYIFVQGVTKRIIWFQSVHNSYLLSLHFRKM